MVVVGYCVMLAQAKVSPCACFIVEYLVFWIEGEVLNGCFRD